MTDATQPQSRSHGWLDSLAIGMSLICAVHCMVTPVLMVLLPVLATTFWAHKDFHMWMLLLVLPTTTTAIFLGCRKHKDLAVAALSFLGMTLLVSVAMYESLFHSTLVQNEHDHCIYCAQRELGDIFNTTTLVNILGAVFLTSAHARNFLLCRRAHCCHESPQRKWAKPICLVHDA